MALSTLSMIVTVCLGNDRMLLFVGESISGSTAEHISITNWFQKFQPKSLGSVNDISLKKCRRSKQSNCDCIWLEAHLLVVVVVVAVVLAVLQFPEKLRSEIESLSSWSFGVERCWSCLSHRRRDYNTVFVSFLIIICKCLIDRPPLSISNRLSIALAHVFLCRACAAHFEGNKSQTQTKLKLKMHWKKNRMA